MFTSTSAGLVLLVGLVALAAAALWAIIRSAVMAALRDRDRHAELDEWKRNRPT